MQFSNTTKISPDATKDNIPVIHGTDYYIDEQRYVCTYVQAPDKVLDKDGDNVTVTSFQQVTEFIYVVNQKLAFKTSDGIIVTELVAEKEKYIGGFQGIAGFNETDISYQYINDNEPPASNVMFNCRINNSKQLEIQVGEKWVVPLGEFRVYINDTFYTLGYNTTLPNTFGDTFTASLAGWTNVELTTDTNYIRDIFIQGNTLYLSTRLQLIGSTPYDWKSILQETSTVLWSEDIRLVGGYYAGDPTASFFYIVNYNTSSVYYIDASDFTIKQEYHHRIPIMGANCLDKYLLAIVDKEAVSVLQAYVSLNTWLIKTKIYKAFNQMSAFEDITTQYLREKVTYAQDINTIVIHGVERTPMLCYVIADEINSICHTDLNISSSEYGLYTIKNGELFRYKLVEENGQYDPVNLSLGVTEYTSCIYIGSDLEPDLGGSTLSDTQIQFEGKIAIIDEDSIIVESSADTPLSPEDLPIRTNQENPENWWYLYNKTLRLPVSYTDWLKISMMPTTKIGTITLYDLGNKETKPKKDKPTAKRKKK